MCIGEIPAEDLVPVLIPFIVSDPNILSMVIKNAQINIF